MPDQKFVVRPVTDPADPALPAFGRLQDRTYPDPEMLIPASVLPRMLAARATGERINLMLVAEQDGEVVGGSFFHYFAGPNTGFSSFLTVAPEVRGQGVAKALHAARFDLLDRHAGPKAPVNGLFIDVVAPERMSPEELAAEHGVGMDPWDRRRIFHRMGFRKVDVAYFQPAEGSGGSPITTMDLLYCPHMKADAVPTALVSGTMLAYWAPWLGRAAAERNAAELRRRCGGDTVALLPGYSP